MQCDIKRSFGYQSKMEIRCSQTYSTNLLLSHNFVRHKSPPYTPVNVLLSHRLYQLKEYLPRKLSSDLC